jgi:hypothetical protein
VFELHHRRDPAGGGRLLKETFEAMGFSKPAAQSYARIVAGEGSIRRVYGAGASGQIGCRIGLRRGRDRSSTCRK